MVSKHQNLGDYIKAADYCIPLYIRDRRPPAVTDLETIYSTSQRRRIPPSIITTINIITIITMF